MKRRTGFRPPNELIALVVDRMGFSHDALRLVVFIHEWARLEAELGRRALIEDFIRSSSDSRRTCYDRLFLFRSVFAAELGEKCTPVDLIRWSRGIPAQDDVASIEWRVAVA